MILDLLVHRIESGTVAVSKVESPESVFEVPRFTTKWMSPPAPGAIVTAAVPEGPPLPTPRRQAALAKLVPVPVPVPEQKVPAPKRLPPLSRKAKIAARKAGAEAFRDRVLAADKIRDPDLAADIARLGWRHWEAIRRAAIGAMDKANIEIQLMTARKVLEMLVSRKSLTANKMRNVAAAYLRKLDAPPASLLLPDDSQ